MLTLEQFRATGRDTDSIGHAIGDSALEGVAGRVYVDVLFIERAETGREWGVMLDNAFTEFAPLTDAEAHLYEWAAAAGYCGDDDAEPVALVPAPAPAAAAIPSTVLREVFRTQELDAAVRLIQDALGIKSGDTAALYLGGGDKHWDWAMGSGWSRAALLAPWLAAELAEAGEMYGPVESEHEAKRNSYARDEPTPPRLPITLDRTR